MTFLHPFVLLGLAAAAIPALLHLFARRRPPEIDFPAVRYLSEAEQQSARRLKLHHLLLLALRTSLIALVVLAAARPLVPSAGGGSHEPTALAVILDNSPSSGVVVDGRPLLDRLKDAARAALVASGPDDHLWLLSADGGVRRGARAALLAAVESAAVSFRRLDLGEAVERAARIVATDPRPGREVDVVSDLQRGALGGGSAKVPRGVRILALAPQDVPAANVGLGPVRVTGGALAVTLVGTPGTRPGAVTLRVGGRVVGRALASVGGTVSFTLPPLGPGWWEGEVALPPDELRADDRGLLVWHVAPPARVTSGPGAGEFVRAALGVLRDGRRVSEGSDVVVDARLTTGVSVVVPPADPALVGEVNRTLAGRGVLWRFAGLGTPGPIATSALEGLGGVAVTRRERLVSARGGGEGTTDSAVLATVNGEPWLVRDGGVVLVGSRLDTAWTALPLTSAFVPFVDALVNRLARGEAAVTWSEGEPHVEFRMRGTDTVGAVVYGPDPRESDLTPAPAALVERQLGARLLDAHRLATARFAGGRRADTSGMLVALALLVALVELGVATLGR